MIKKALKVTCVDGYEVSIQAFDGAYCAPRDNTGPYTKFELGFPSAVDHFMLEWAESPGEPLDTVYPYVPIEVIKRLLDSHGGPAAYNWFEEYKKDLDFPKEKWDALFNRRIEFLQMMGYFNPQYQNPRDYTKQTLMNLKLVYAQKWNNSNEEMLLLEKRINEYKDELVAMQLRMGELAERQKKEIDDEYLVERLLDFYCTTLNGEDKSNWREEVAGQNEG